MIQASVDGEIINSDFKPYPWLQSIGLFFVNVWQYRVTIWYYFMRDFVGSYRGSFLGMVWKIVMPMLPISVYVVLQKVGILKGASHMPRIVFVVLGFTLWDLFSSALTVTSARIKNQAAVISKTRIPLEVVYVSGLGQIIFDFCLRCLLAWSIMFFFMPEFSFRWFFIPVLGMPILILGFGLGILSSFFASVSQDFTELITIFLRYAIFACGVLFPISGSVRGINLASINPIYSLVDFPRAWITNTALDGSMSCYFWAVGFSLTVFMVAVKKSRDLSAFLLGEV